MTANRTCKIFVNLSVHDLKRSVDFFTKLGFGFDTRFTDEQATCMIVSEEAFVMLLVEKRFQEFARKPLADATRATEGILAITAGSRAEVDEVVNTALGAGGSRAADPMDLGFLYLRSFYDPDGHHWEVFHMDPAAVAR